MSKSEAELPERFKIYLQAKALHDDDRSMSYIAKKLGFNSASSIQSLFSTYGWVAAYAERQGLLARFDELDLIPVIETTGVGYETIVAHRKERYRQLHEQSKDKLRAEQRVRIK